MQNKTTYNNTYIKWLDNLPEVVEKGFVEDIPFVAEKIEQPPVKILSSATEILFDLSPPATWAMFVEFKGYENGFKKIFKHGTLSCVDTTKALEKLSNLKSTKSITKIKDMLQSVEELKTFLEHIYLEIFSSCRS